MLHHFSRFTYSIFHQAFDRSAFEAATFLNVLKWVREYQAAKPQIYTLLIHEKLLHVRSAQLRALLA